MLGPGIGCVRAGRGHCPGQPLSPTGRPRPRSLRSGLLTDSSHCCFVGCGPRGAPGSEQAAPGVQCAGARCARNVRVPTASPVSPEQSAPRSSPGGRGHRRSPFLGAAFVGPLRGIRVASTRAEEPMLRRQWLRSRSRGRRSRALVGTGVPASRVDLCAGAAGVEADRGSGG